MKKIEAIARMCDMTRRALADRNSPMAQRETERAARQVRFVNLTPHSVTILREGREPLTIPSSGVVRVGTTSLRVYTVESIPCVRQEYSEIDRLPDPVPGTMYIVSLIALQAIEGRSDVCAPATGPNDGAVRDDRGQIVAVTKLVVK